MLPAECCYEDEFHLHPTILENRTMSSQDRRKSANLVRTVLSKYGIVAFSGIAGIQEQYYITALNLKREDVLNQDPEFPIDWSA